MRTTLLAVFLTGAPATSSAGQDQEALLSLGRSLSADFWAGRLDPVWARMSPQMQEALGGSPAGLATAREQILALSGGGPGELLAERVGEVQGIAVYLRTFRGTPGAQALLEQWALEDGTVVGFIVRPTELKAPDQKTERVAGKKKYVLAACALAGTALAMATLSLWLKRRRKKL